MVKANEDCHSWEHRKVAYRTCRVKFRRNVNLDYMDQVEAKTNWRVQLLDANQMLLACNDPEESADMLMQLSRQHGNCCRYIQLSRR
jgi:hypothetical protein